MKAEQYLKLQIGMYVTDSKDNDLRPVDFWKILQFRNGKIQFQSLDEYGQPIARPFWLSYKKVELTRTMLRSDYVALFPECGSSQRMKVDVQPTDSISDYPECN